MKLTRTDAVFSRAACMFILCAEKGEFKHLRKIQENSQKIHAPEESGSQKMDQRGATPGPGSQRARPPPWPRPPAAWTGGASPQPPPFGWYFYSRRGNPETEVDTQFSVAEPPPPLFFLGRANLGAVLASGEGKSTPSSSPSPLHHPSMSPPSMCE